DVESGNAVGVELKSGTPWVKEITKLTYDAVRVTIDLPQGLRKQDEKTGKIGGYTIDYTIELSTDNGTYEQVHSGRFTGKTSQNYQRSVRIDLPKATSNWKIRVTRTT